LNTLKTLLQVISTLTLVAGMLYLGHLGQQAVAHMQSMDAHTMKTAQTIEGMARQIQGMHEGIQAIDEHIATMSGHTKSMSVQLYGMRSETANMEDHIERLNIDMGGIQNSVSADLESMRKGVDSMAYDVRYMRENLVQMSGDIRRGSEAVSSPQQYFRNMFDYGP
jgi:TolA-binding protein